MKRLLPFIAFTITLLFFVSNTYSQERKKLNIDNFTKISLNISADVELRQGNTQEVIAEGSKRLIDLLDTEVTGQKWSIEYTERNVRTNNEKLRIIITIPKLEAVKINSSGDITGSGTFSADDFYIGINGSGDIDLSIDVKDLKLSINGSGDMRLSGKAEMTDANINGSGDIKAGKLKSNVADININGSGDVNIHVNDRLEAKVNGSGDINYSGDPDIKSKSYGSGNVRKKG